MFKVVFPFTSSNRILYEFLITHTCHVFNRHNLNVTILTILRDNKSFEAAHYVIFGPYKPVFLSTLSDNIHLFFFPSK
jgi:hypothetical protein